MRSLRRRLRPQLLFTTLFFARNTYAQFNTSSLPTCDQNCFQQAILSQTGCSDTDTVCLCDSQTVSASLRECLELTCSYDDVVAARNYALNVCPSFAPTSNPPGTSSPAPSVTGSATPSKGLPATTKIAIGVVVPVATISLLFLFLFLRHTRKERRQNALPPPATAGGYPSHGHDGPPGKGESVAGLKKSDQRDRSRSRSVTRGVGGRRSNSTLGKTGSRHAMSETRSGIGSFGIGIGRKKSNAANSTHSRNVSSGTAPLVASEDFETGTRGVPFGPGESPLPNSMSPDLEKARSETDSEGSHGMLNKIGSVSGSSGRAPSTYQSLEPITEPSSTAYQSQSSSAYRPLARDAALTVPSNVAVSVYNNTERVRLASSPYATHQSDPLPPPSPGVPISRQFIYESSDENRAVEVRPRSKQHASAIRGRRSTSGNRRHGSRSASREGMSRKPGSRDENKANTSWLQMNGPTAGGSRLSITTERDVKPDANAGKASSLRPPNSQADEAVPKKGRKSAGHNLKIETGRSRSSGAAGSEPRWKQWRDRKSADMMSPLSSPTSSEAPKIESSYNAI